MDVQVIAQPTGHDVVSDGMGSTGAGSGRAPVSATRQCVCGGWTRYIVCQYCGTTDPHAAAAGMISMTPLVQRSPEEADAHSAAATANGHAGGAAWEPGTQPAAFAEAGTHAAPPLPPTTFAEAQFGAAPSAAAVFASTADAPTPAFASFRQPEPAAPPLAADQPPAAAAFTGSAFSSPPAAPAEATPFSEPIPGWGDAPVPAPPGWASAAPAAPSFRSEPGAAAPAPVSAFGTASPGAVSAPEVDVPAEGPTADSAVDDAATPYHGPAEPATVAYPTPPASYEMPPELAATRQPLRVSTAEVPAADVTDEPVRASKRSLPRWAVPAAAAVVVIGGAGLYLSSSGGGGSAPVAPVVRHSTAPVQTKTTGTTGVAPAANVAPATRLATAAPTGFTATGPGTPVTGAALSAADSIHRTGELTAAGVTSATVTTFNGPGGLTITVLTETAASPAQATELATHARHFGFTMQAANGATVFSLHSLAKTDPIVSALTTWTTALKG